MRQIERDSWKRIYRVWLISICIGSIAFAIWYGYMYFENGIPSNITIMVNKEGIFSSELPVTAEFSKECIDIISVDNRKIKSKSMPIKISDEFSISSEKTGKYKANIKAFGIFNLKEVNVNVIDEKKLIAGGLPIGIYIETDGLLVLGSDKVKGKDGVVYEPSANVLKTGDYIMAIDGHKLANKEELINILHHMKKDSVVLTVRRNNEFIKVLVKIIQSSNSKNDNKLGVWIRNDMQGIGTLTFYDKSKGIYAALGHGINDTDTSVLMKVKKGMIYGANILNVIKGVANDPGELVGVINKGDEYEYGTIVKNTKKGIYGRVNSIEEKRIMNELSKDELIDEYEIGLKQDIKIGKAKIRSKVDNEIKEYDIRVENIDLTNRNINKSFIIRIIDKELLSKTNGIVQGMSGSPIIQNNKIIGAVTHVFVNEPSRGYGIFIENMLEN